jgi:tetratricopeptide (TPR) repeat protein
LTRAWREQGRLAVVGVVQEQHADRARLFAHWQRFEWPILHDPLNLLELSGVPLVVGLDEQGVVRGVGLRPDTVVEDFLERAFTTPSDAGAATQTALPDVPELRKAAAASRDAERWRSLGDALALWHSPQRIDEALEAYARALELAPHDARTRFRIGVCYRVRFESDRRQPGDLQRALDGWNEALEAEPNQYIWRRRLEQYGPRLAKPYPFYDWVERARAELNARGESPVPLAEEPYGSELASPIEAEPAPAEAPEPDPGARIQPDLLKLIDAEIGVAPARVRPGQAARVHVVLRPSSERHARWNNESLPLRVWVPGVPALSIGPRLLTASSPAEPESDEVRRLDFEVQVPPQAKGQFELSAYALYHVCEHAGGQCLFLRQELPIVVRLRE